MSHGQKSQLFCGVGGYSTMVVQQPSKLHILSLGAILTILDDAVWRFAKCAQRGGFMPNYIISYDLNGSTPTHQQMDRHLEAAGYGRGRILETVWYVKSTQSLNEVGEYVDRILSRNDSLIVVEARDAYARNLLIPTADISAHWVK